MTRKGGVTRLRTGEWLASLASVALFVVLFLNWFGLEGGTAAQAASVGVHTTGWATLGWFVDLLLALTIFGGLAFAYATMRRTSPAWAVSGAVLTSVVGWITFLVLLVRVLTQPNLGVDGLPNSAVTVQLPAYLGLVLAAAIPLGAWLAMHDERTDAPESAYTPPPPRPVPGS
jgi:hypothetical protein